MPTTTGTNVLTYPASGATSWNSTMVTLFQNVTTYIDALDLTIAANTLTQASGHKLEVLDIDVLTAGAINWELGSSLIVESGATFQISAAMVSPAATDLTITPGTTGNLVLDGLNWPQADGSANEVLTTNGAGQLSFASVSSDVVSDTTPQLGGDLDVQANAIVSTGVNDIHIHSNDDVVLELGDALGVKKVSIKDSSAVEVASIDSDGDLVAASLDLGDSGAIVTKIADEDNMVSDSATQLATQQSIKAYVDSVGGGGWTVISATAASASTNVDITLTSGYKQYKIVVANMTVSADDKAPWIRAQTSGGGFRSGVSDYGWRASEAFVSRDTDNADSEIQIMGSAAAGNKLGSAAGEAGSFEIMIHSARASGIFTMVSWSGTYVDAGGTIQECGGHGMVTTAEDNDAIRITMEDATTITGDFILFGLREA